MSTSPDFASVTGTGRLRATCVSSLLPTITLLPLAGLLPGLPLERHAIG